VADPIEPHRAVVTSAPVDARTATGERHDSGRVIAYFDQPAFVIERPDGTQFAWAASLTTAAVIACPETEGVTGIRCGQPKNHGGDHEGTTDDQQTEYVGYRMTVRWPYTEEKHRG
jgi:hypothetical protein